MYLHTYPNFDTVSLIFLANQRLGHSRYGDCVLQILIFRNGIFL
jgi:hypothetical protein